MANINYCSYGFSDFTKLYVVNGEDLDFQSVSNIINAGGEPIFNIPSGRYEEMVQRVAPDAQTLLNADLALRWDDFAPHYDFMNIRITVVDRTTTAGIVRISFVQIP